VTLTPLDDALRDAFERLVPRERREGDGYEDYQQAQVELAQRGVDLRAVLHALEDAVIDESAADALR
jgi:hypothetical protein